MEKMKHDLTIHAEEYAEISKVFKLLNLDIDTVLIICPELFFQRFIQCVHEEYSEYVTLDLERQLESNNSNVVIDIPFKNKTFKFSFIILHTEIKNIYHPINGSQEYKVGFNVINIK